MTDRCAELAHRLKVRGLLREKQRREMEREYKDLPRSARAKRQNAADIWCLIPMLIEIKEHFANTPPVDATTRLLSRLINALHDVSVGATPTLFDVEPQSFWHSEGAKPTGSSAAASAEGAAAVAAELLISAKMSVRDAEAWLDRVAKGVHLHDRNGDPVTGHRITEWRRKFRQGRGSALGRRMYDIGTTQHRAVINSPSSELKTRKAQGLAADILDRLARSAPAEITLPQG